MSDTRDKGKQTSDGNKPSAEKDVANLFAQLIRVQVAVIKQMGEFAGEATKMTLSGSVSPVDWMKLYGAMWTKLAAELSKRS